MTVNELIEQLKDYPGDMRVLTLGYEGGLNDTTLTTHEVVFDFNNKDTKYSHWYYGPHEYAKYVGEDGKGTECLIIGRAK